MGEPISQTGAEFCQYFDRIRARTDRVVALIPEERLEWTYRDGKFTFGDLVRHLAGTERYMFAENARGRPSRYPGHGRELADGKAAVVAYAARLHRDAMAIFGGLSDEDLRARCETPGGGRLPVWKWLRAMIEHEVHHRGQIYLMLNMIAVETPALYGLTEEEVLARSQAPER